MVRSRWLRKALETRFQALLLAASCSLVGPLATAATPGELLQKAIYAEETVGNLDEAIRLYEQVVAEAKDATAAAAEAQYRRGLCLTKQDKPDQAKQAFQTLIESYPSEADWVAKAKHHLQPPMKLLPEPWGNGDTLTLHLHLATGIPIGVMINRVEPVTRDGREYWRCSTRGYTAINNTNGFSEVLCDKQTFAPVHGVWEHTLLGRAEATYQEKQVIISTANEANKATLPLDEPIWDNEQGIELFRRLPLEVGYRQPIVVVSSLGSHKIPIDLEVTEKKTIEVPAGKFDCFKLVLSIGQTFWISDDPQRRLVRFEASGVIGDLVSVEPHDANSEARPWSPTPDLTLTVPAGWYSYHTQSQKDSKFNVAYLLDPAGEVTAELKWGPKSSLKPEYRESARAWSEGFVADKKNEVSDFQVVAPGIQEFKLGDVSAYQLKAERTEHQRRVTLYGVALFHGETALTIRFTMEPEMFDQQKETIDRLVQSLQIK